MTVSIANAWSGSFAQPAAFGTMPPALQGVPVALTAGNSVGGGSGAPTAGNWLVCVTGMNEQSASAAATVGCADDAHSFWRPGDVTKSNWAASAPSALTRTSVWYTANTVRAPGYVYVSPSGCLDAFSILILEISGLGPWDTITGIYGNYAAAATSLNLALAAPSSQALLIAAVTGDNTSAGQAFAPAGWTALPSVSVSNGSDHTCDCVLNSAYILTTGAVSVNGTATSAEDLSGVVIGFQVNAASPLAAGANPAWPQRFIAEAGFGSGYTTPPDQVTWTTLTDSAWPHPWNGTSAQFKRAWGWSDRSGIQWGLGTYMPSRGTITLDNFDGWLSPSNPGSGFYFSPAAVNSNPCFQVTASPWTARNGAALALSSAQVFASASQALSQYSAMVTPNGTTALPGIISEKEAVSASSPYSASAWFYTGTAYATGAQVAISWYTSGGTLISTVTATAAALPAATWTQVTLANQVSPSNAATAAITAQLAGTPSAGQVFWAAEAVLAAGSSVPQSGGVDSGTPVRLRMALGSVTGPSGTVTYNRWYVWQRNIQSWPEKRNKAFRGYVEASTTDPWQSATGSSATPYRAEVEQDNPGWWWPCDDQPLAGGVLPVSLRNAATGSTTVLNIEAAPAVGSQDQYSSGIGFGSGGTDLSSISTSAQPSVATYAVGQQAGWMYGDPQVSPQSSQTGNPVTAQPGSAAWQQSGMQGSTGGNCWFLAANDTFPSLATGVTVTGWFNVGFLGSASGLDNSGTFYNVAQNSYAPITLFELATSTGGVAALQLTNPGGHLVLLTGSGLGTSTAVYSSSDLRCGAWFKVTLELTASTYTVWVNGSLTASASGSWTAPSSSWNWFIAGGDLGTSGGSALSAIKHSGNMAISHLQIYPGLLRQYRELAHYSAAITGCGLLPAPTSMQASTVVNQQPTGFVPDGTEYQGSYGSGGSSFSVSALAVAVAGSYTSGPAARATTAAHGFGTPSSFGGAIWVQWNTLAPLVQVYTAAAANAETEASAVLGSGDSYTTGYGATASGHGVGHVSAGSGASPPAGPSSLGDTVQTRLERILSYAGITGPRAIDPASLMVQAALDVGGQQPGASVTGIVASDNGWWFYDLQNVACYRMRGHLNSDTVVWQIGMNVTSGQIPFAGDIEPDNDPQRVFADITVNPYSPDGASLPEIVPAAYQTANAAGAQYGPRSLSVTSYLQSAAEQQSQANWLLSYYGTLRKRLKVLTIDAASHPAAWGIVLGLNNSDLISVYDAPFGAPATTTTYRVSYATRTLSFGANGLGIQGKLVIVGDPVLPLWS